MINSVNPRELATRPRSCSVHGRNASNPRLSADGCRKSDARPSWPKSGAGRRGDVQKDALRRTLLGAELSIAWHQHPELRDHGLAKCSAILGVISDHWNCDQQIAYVTKTAIAGHVNMTRKTVAKWCLVLEGLGLIIQGQYVIRNASVRRTYSVFGLGAGISERLPARVNVRKPNWPSDNLCLVRWWTGREALEKRGIDVETRPATAEKAKECVQNAQAAGALNGGVWEKITRRTCKTPWGKSVAFQRKLLEENDSSMSGLLPVGSFMEQLSGFSASGKGFGRNSARNWARGEGDAGREAEQDWNSPTAIGFHRSGDASALARPLSKNAKINWIKLLFDEAFHDLPSYLPAYGTPRGRMIGLICSIGRAEWLRLVEIVRARPMLCGKIPMSNGFGQFKLNFYWLMRNATSLLLKSAGKGKRKPSQFGLPFQVQRASEPIEAARDARKAALLARLASVDPENARRSANKFGISWQLVSQQNRFLRQKRHDGEVSRRRASCPFAPSTNSHNKGETYVSVAAGPHFLIC